MPEFDYGDRVRWISPKPHDGACGGLGPCPGHYGSVIDESRSSRIFGCFDDCLPQPVAVLFDEPGEVWWTPGEELQRV